MTTKAKELDNRKEGDRNSCPICNPSKKRVREDQVWGRCPTNQKHSHAGRATKEEEHRND